MRVRNKIIIVHLAQLENSDFKESSLKKEEKIQIFLDFLMPSYFLLNTDHGQICQLRIKFKKKPVNYLWYPDQIKNYVLKLTDNFINY